MKLVNTDLEIAIKKMLYLKTTVPIIVEVLGRIKKGTDKHMNKILGSLSLYEI